MFKMLKNAPWMTLREIIVLLVFLLMLAAAPVWVNPAYGPEFPVKVVLHGAVNIGS